MTLLAIFPPRYGPAGGRARVAYCRIRADRLIDLGMSRDD